MFGIFKKDPSRKLKKQYDRLLEQARDLQRSGDIRGFAEKTEQAEGIRKQIDDLKSNSV